MEQPHIVVRGLTHMYESGPRSVTALIDVNLEVRHGEFVSIIGPSGGGKTTLLRAMGGLLEPSAGGIQVDGGPPVEAQRRRDIGFVFQDPSLLPWRTVRRNMELPLELNVGAHSREKADVERWLDAVGLTEFGDFYPHELSGGMRQRVAFARALVTDPGLLLMDEPLGALDEITRTAMRYELLRVWDGTGKTVVLVTHSIPEAIMMSDRVAVMSSRPGSIVAQVLIDLPRPREASLERSTRFLDYVNDLKDTLFVGAADGTSAPWA